MNLRTFRHVAVIPLVLTAVLLTPASADSQQGVSRGQAHAGCHGSAASSATVAPSTLDYVVLASLADASTLLSMTRYKTASVQLRTGQSTAASGPATGE